MDSVGGATRERPSAKIKFAKSLNMELLRKGSFKNFLPYGIISCPKSNVLSLGILGSIANLKVHV